MKDCFVILPLLVVLAAPSADAGPIVASDTGSNYGTDWLGNGGFGFDDWSFQTDLDDGPGFAGSFLAATGTHGDLNYIWSMPDFKAWGTFANGPNAETMAAFRGFSDISLDENYSFLISMENGLIQTGGKTGFTLRTGNANGNSDAYNIGARFEFFFEGGDANYSILDDTGTKFDTGIGFTPDGLDLVFTRTGPNLYHLEVFSANGGASLGTFDRTLGGTSGASLDSVALYNRDVESANVYFNKMQIMTPLPPAAWAGLAMLGLFVGSNRLRKRQP